MSYDVPAGAVRSAADERLNRILYMTMVLSGTEHVFLYLSKKQERKSVLHGACGAFRQLSEVHLLGELVKGVYATGEIKVMFNYSTFKYRLPDSVFGGVYYLAMIPMQYKKRLIGVIGIAYSSPGQFLTEEKLSLLQRFANFSAIAVCKQIHRRHPVCVPVKEAGAAVSNELRSYAGHDRRRVKFYCRNSRKHYGLFSAGNVFDYNQQGFLANTQGLLRQRKTEKMRRVFETKFTRLFSMLPDAVIIIRQDKVCMEVNEGFTHMSGFSSEEVVGKKCAELKLWLNAEEQQRFERALCNYGEFRDMLVRFRHKNGYIVHTQVSAGSMFLNAQYFYMMFIRDITEQVQAEKAHKQQEEALMVSRNKLSAAAALVGLGPWEYDPETDLFDFDDEFYALCGTNAAREGRYMSFECYVREFVHPEDWRMFKNERAVLAARHEDAPADIMHRIIQRSGEVRCVLVRRRFARNGEGQVIRVHGINQDITEWERGEADRQQKTELIRQMAYFDPLTKLANRHNLNEYLDKEMEAARRKNAVGTILFVDVDDLKLVNDTCGHSAGDAVIVLLAARLQRAVPEAAFVARIGGDEFVVVLKGLHERDRIEKIVHEISRKLEWNQEISGARFQLTVSIGIALYPKDGDTREEIIKNADNAMYTAKESGKRGQSDWRFYTEEMQRDAYRKIRLTEGLRCAVERGECSLVYQPQVLINTRRVVGFEALLRWNSLTHGNVPPGQFIPLAEQSGLIQGIGKWVLERACLFARRLAEQGQRDIRIAVNVSPKQVESEEFIANVREAIETAGIEPQMLELELTESVFMSSLEKANDKLIELKQLGVHLSLDDFGTGFSSLSYLINLPFKTLKIDKSFIDVITTDLKRAEIISSIICMGHAMEMKVIAEGAETEHQVNYLSAHGCDCVQGYVFSKPLTEAEAVAWLRRQTQCS
ncbi:EAL domain-containing protein [Anaerosinus massiliensis]|uniref:EAL domain-containing protein n=1 Tax=Massilibacillus massiliensis TaxID=1806837 RepID=UPI000DA634AE|nr:EAL domain-containing protein [Massilibacillus massiliensis]